MSSIEVENLGAVPLRHFSTSLTMWFSLLV